MARFHKILAESHYLLYRKRVVETTGANSILALLSDFPLQTIRKNKGK